MKTMAEWRQAYSDDDSPDRYSDDFVSDEDEPAPSRRRSGNNQLSTPQGFSHRKSYQDRSGGRRGGGAGPRGRGRGGRRGRGHSRNSEPADTRRSNDTVTQRVLSASRNKVNELRNKVEELKIHIRNVEQENKLYKKMQFRQEKAIRGFEHKENDLPNILEKNANEVRSLKEHNRRLREKFEKSDRYLRDAEDELERVKNKLKKYKDMCEQKELLERDELSRKVTKAEIDMEEKDVKIKELQRHIEVLKKNHRHELGIEVARQKEMKRQVEEMAGQKSKIETQLKEREKELEYKNIYSNRASQDRDDSPMRKQKLKASSSMTDLTPRDKAKFYAEKQREELRKQKQLKIEQENKKRQKWEEEEKEKAKNEAPSTPPKLLFNSIDQQLMEKEKDEQLRREEQQDIWRERENAEKQQKEELERKRRELERRQEENRKIEEEDRVRRQKEDKLRREKEERERKEREDREVKQREEQAKRDREEREQREEHERKERLESQRREKEKLEQERRLEQERQKLENDPSIQAERQKKDELLKKLKAMDEMGSAGTRPDPFAPTPPNKRSKENSRGGSFGDGYESPGKRSDRKEYSFSKPVNNLHQGKPSHEDIAVPYLDKQRGRWRPSKDDDDSVGYQPSFGSTRHDQPKSTSTKPLSIFDDDAILKNGSNSMSNVPSKNEKKSSNLLENLFGSQAVGSTTTNDKSKKRSEENETFFVTSKSPEINFKSLDTGSKQLPWESSVSPSKSNTNRSTLQSDNKSGSTIFGGGTGLFDDEISPRNSRPLPRRQRQPNLNTISAKPSVTAVDNFDDDIEEVVL